MVSLKNSDIMASIPTGQRVSDISMLQGTDNSSAKGFPKGHVKESSDISELGLYDCTAKTTAG